MNIIRKIRIKLKEIKYLKYIDNHRMNIDLAFDEMVQNQAMQEWFTWTEDFVANLKKEFYYMICQNMKMKNLMHIDAIIILLINLKKC